MCKAKCSTDEWELNRDDETEARDSNAGLAGGHVGSSGETWLQGRVFASGHGVNYVSLSGTLWSSPAEWERWKQQGCLEADGGDPVLRVSGIWVSLSEVNPVFGPGDSRALQNCPPGTPTTGHHPAPLRSPLRSLLEMMAFDGWDATSWKTLLQKNR